MFFDILKYRHYIINELLLKITDNKNGGIVVNTDIIWLSILAGSSAFIAALFCWALSLKHIRLSDNALNIPNYVLEAPEDASCFDFISNNKDLIPVMLISLLVGTTAMLMAPFLNAFSGGYGVAYALLWGVVSSCFITTAIIDWRHYVIPHYTNFILFISTILMLGVRYLAAPDSNIVWFIIPGVSLFLVFFVLEIFGKMGGGDTKLIISLGFLLGPLILFALFYSSIISVIYKMFFAKSIEKNKDLPKINLKDSINDESIISQPIPYGPFLVAGTIITILTFEWSILLLQIYIFN